MLLEEDPDLRRGIAHEELELALRRAVAPALDVVRPSWDASAISEQAEPGWLGLLVLDGLLLRRVRAGGRWACELFGPGDVLRPWDAANEHEPLATATQWLVLRDSRLAVLDTDVARRIARWPSINACLLGRVARRAQDLALSQAVTSLPKADARLLLIFWLLADRWGKVAPTGVRVHLPLTHDVLGMLIGTQRPTVTLALHRLATAGLLIRERKDRWLLTNGAIESLNRLDDLLLQPTT